MCPWDNVPKNRWPAMERCVEGMKNKGADDDRANAVCYTSIMGKSSLLNIQAATEEDIEEIQGLVVQASIPSSEIWKIKGACLARSEKNLNNDAITDEGIQQIASSIRLKPLTQEHEREPRGIFIKGYANEDSTECLVDILGWAGMFPDFFAEIKSGERKLSMDVEAKIAVCGVCGAVFNNELEYCSHMRNRSDGAVRWLYDLTAVAGGAVRYPAGNGTVFPGKEGFTVISHNLAVAEWWKKHWDKESEIPASAFADKKDRKYPFKGPSGEVDKEGWMAAWKYAHAHKAQSVINVLKRNLPKGYKLEGDSVVKTAGGAKMQIVCSECGHEQEVVTDAEKVQAELEAKISELQEAQSKLTEAQEAVANLESEVQVEKRVVERFVELAAEAGIEFAQETLPSLRKADDDVFKTFKAMASRLGRRGDEPEDPPASPPENVVASETDPPIGADSWEVEV